jgi:hypothetical protein
MRPIFVLTPRSITLGVHLFGINITHTFRF